MSLKAFFSSLKHTIQSFREWCVFRKQQIRNKIKVCLLIFFCGSIFFVGLYAFVRPPFTPLMVWRCIQQINDYQWPIWQRKRVPIEDISPYMVYAVIAGEDNKFVTHF